MTPAPTPRILPVPALSGAPAAAASASATALDQRKGPARARRSRGAMRSRHIEAHAVAWLRSLRQEAHAPS